MRDISLHILDVVQNSLAAAASKIEIEIYEVTEKDFLSLVISDNGRGMNDEQAKRALNPFYTTRTTRKVGLGLSLLQANAQACGGDLLILSELGRGTIIKAHFILGHIDRPPLGDMASTLTTLVCGNPQVTFIYKHHRDDRGFGFDTLEVQQILGGIDLNHPEVFKWIKDFLQGKENELYS